MGLARIDCLYSSIIYLAALAFITSSRMDCSHVFNALQDNRGVVDGIKLSSKNGGGQSACQPS